MPRNSVKSLRDCSASRATCHVDGRVPRRRRTRPSEMSGSTARHRSRLARRNVAQPWPRRRSLRRARHGIRNDAGIDDHGSGALMRYRVELDVLLAFVDKLQSFERRAEAIAARVDRQVADLHTTWSGEAAAAHRAQTRRVGVRCNTDAGSAHRTAAGRTPRPPQIHRSRTAQSGHVDVTQDVDPEITTRSARDYSTEPASCTTRSP